MNVCGLPVDQIDRIESLCETLSSTLLFYTQVLNWETTSILYRGAGRGGGGGSGELKKAFSRFNVF